MQVRRRLFGLAKSEPYLLFWLGSGSFFTAVVVIVQMYLLSMVISDVFIESRPVNPGIMISLIVLVLARGIISWLRERYAQQKTVKIKRALRDSLFRHLPRLGPSYTRAGKTGEIVTVMVDGVEKLDDYFTRYIPSVVHIAIITPVIVCFAVYADWLSGLILFLTAPLIVFFMWLIGTYAHKLTRDQWGQMSRVSSRFLDALQGIKTLRLFGASEQEASMVDHSSNLFREITMKVLQVAFLSGLVLELAASLSIAMVALQVGIRLIEGWMNYQLGLFVLLLAPEFYIPFRLLGQHHHAGMEGAAAAEKIFEFLDTPSRVREGQVKQVPNPHALRISFDDASYTYPGNFYPALAKASFQLEPGTITALVGRSGSGKTTLAYLLLGYLNSTGGEIRVNDVPLSRIDPTAWFNLVSYVPQHPHFFNATVRDNLLYARPGAGVDEIEAATTGAGAHEFIMQLPQGYDTPLHENASRLSGGERQRLAIARALLKNAPLLVLDEPTSNLDPASEQVIARAMQGLVKDRTTLVIAHRLQTIYRANTILVLHDGRVVERGNHGSLILQDGIYARFMEAGGLRLEDAS